MSHRGMRQVATMVQRAPWAVRVARSIWRIGQPKFSAGVVGVIFDEVERVLLVEHVFHPHLPWGLPGGWVSRRESPSETVKRELGEELSLIIEVGPILLVEIDDGNHLDFAYLCYKAGEIGKMSRELLDYGWYEMRELPRLHSFHYRAIIHALTLQKLA